MKAAFDVSVVAHAVGGVARYATSLAEALRAVAPERGIDLSVVDVPATHPGVPSPGVADTALPDPAFSRVPLVRRLAARLGRERASRARRLAGLLAGCRVFHASGVQPVAPEGSATVVTVYDLSGLRHPEWHTPETVAFSRELARLVESGAAVAAISGWTASQVEGIPGADPSRIRVIGGAADRRFSPGSPSREVLERYGLTPYGYLLHVGGIVPRKNVPFLAEAYGRARARGLELDLALAGERPWGGESVPGGNGVRLLSGVPDDDLPELYRGSVALLIPSEHEGLGLPALEALACGAPVIASNCTALTETVGRFGLLLPPGDMAGWASELLLLGSPSHADMLAARALRAPRPTWEDVAGRLCDLYLELA